MLATGRLKVLHLSPADCYHTLASIIILFATTIHIPRTGYPGIIHSIMHAKLQWFYVIDCSQDNWSIYDSLQNLNCGLWTGLWTVATMDYSVKLPL